MKKSNIKVNITVELVLFLLVIASMIRQLFLGSFQNALLCVLTLILFMIPKFLEKKLSINIPRPLEVIILLFIFSAEILGEINAFYIKIPVWDTILHTMNGFLMAAIGFALIDIFNRSERFSLKMSPYFVAFTAFCFSMTIGVLWEFFEFGADWFFHTDMQKDWIINSIHSVQFRNDGVNDPIHIYNITSTVVNGEPLPFVNGYLDIGLIDTMKDLIVNFIGAIVFSLIGIIYLKNRKETGIAASLIPKVAEKKDE